MALPATLKGFSAFVDGFGFVGKLASGQFPKIAIKTVEHRDGGMDAPIELDMGMEKMESSYTFDEYPAELFKRVGLLDGTKVSITLRGSMEDEDGQTLAVIANVLGKIKEADPNEWKSGGEKAQPKFTHAAEYFKLTIDNEDVIEVDVVNVTRVIGGVDQLAARRSNLGI